MRVVPVGDRGTRGGIGTRVEVKTANDQHWRQIMAAASDRQEESVAHFGLGSDSTELLVVTWPSSQVDTIRRPQLDETIYVYEGRTIYTYFATLPSSWHLSTPDTLIAEQTTELELLVRPSLEETESGIEHVVADLSALGGDGGLPLTAVGFSASLSLTAPVPGMHEVAHRYRPVDTGRTPLDRIESIARRATAEARGAGPGTDRRRSEYDMAHAGEGRHIVHELREWCHSHRLCQCRCP